MQAGATDTEITVKSVTPILVVPAIEPCLAFYASLGFVCTVTVPEASPFNFAILANGAIEIMLQAQASVAQDVPAVAAAVRASVLYIGVEAIGPVLAALPDASVAVARRTTFYGADEIFLYDPAGNIVGLSAPAP